MPPMRGSDCDARHEAMRWLLGTESRIKSNPKLANKILDSLGYVNGAVLSADGKYRYRLSRVIELTGDGSCTFVMLNPSTADAMQDDPTIRRCIGYARTLACARLDVVNLFAYRSTDPGVLSAMSRDVAVGPENDQHIMEVCRAARLVICGWGNHGSLFQRGAEVRNMLRTAGVTPLALKINGKSGQPAHPLYLKADAQPVKIGL